MIYLLDTNIASYLLKNRDRQLARTFRQRSRDVCLSAISEAEMLFGLAANPQASNVAKAVHGLLGRVDILPWDSVAASAYAGLKSELQRQGLSLSAMDMLIAAHALSINAVLVTSDQAFYKAAHLLKLENWRAN